MFTQKSFTPVSSHGNSDSPNSWSYRTDDTQAEVIAEDYFAKKYPVLNHGDFISVECSNSIFSGAFIKSLGKFTVLNLSAGASSIDRVVANEYVNVSPSAAVEYDTGYDPAPITETTTEISAIALVSAGGNQYAVFSRASATALVGNPDVRISRSSTFPGISGAAEMVFWYDSVTSTIHIQADLNGGGKVLDIIQVTSAYDKPI